MKAFCVCPLHTQLTPRRATSVQVLPNTLRIAAVPYARTSKSPSKKRPRPSDKKSSDFPGSSPDVNKDNNTSSVDSIPSSHVEESQVLSDDERRQRNLQAVDANGISLEHRLREEIQNPLRKPKQTLFGTLTFSATLGFLIAVSRLAADKDSFMQGSKNVAIDAIATILFGYLTWREVEFGRRSLNSIAGCPQPRDLLITRLNTPSTPAITLPIFNAASNTPTDTERMASALRTSDVLVVAGRTADLRKYLDRCMQDNNYASEQSESSYSTMHPTLVALPTDVRNDNDLLAGATAVASLAEDGRGDWFAWLGDAVPPRRNVALFRIETSDIGNDPASSYIVVVDDPLSAPLPEEATKLTVVEV